MTFASDILGDLDDIRGIPDALGIRPYAVSVLTRTWSADSLGGAYTDSTTPLLLANGLRPKVRQVAYKETVAAGGRYQEGDYRIGPMTPTYDGGGVAYSTLAPARPNSRTEVYYIVSGPDTPAEGRPCVEVGVEADKPLRRTLILRPTGTIL